MKIKHGNTRTVFVFNNFVIKIPSIIRFLYFRRDYLDLKKHGIKTGKDYVKYLFKYAKRDFNYGLNANRVAISSYKKYKPKFVPKIFFNIGNLIIFNKKMEGEKYNPYDKNSFINSFINFDEYFHQNWKDGLYSGHDIWTEDWVRTDTGFILIDNGGNFSTLLAKNKEKVEKILKKEFQKATT